MRRTTTIATVGALASLLAAGQALAQTVPDLRIGSEVKARLDDEDRARNRERAPDGPGAEEPPVIIMDGGAPDILYDDYFFTARAGQRLEAIMRSADFDTYLAVFSEGNTAQNPIVGDDDGLGAGTDSRLRFTPAADGRYVLRAQQLGGGDGGVYTLGLAERPPAPPAQAPTVIVPGEPVSGTISDTDAEADDGAFYDAYRFRAVAGQRLAIRMEAVDEGEETGIDPLLRVGRMQGEVFTELAMNDDDRDGLNASLLFTAPDADDYVIRAEALNGGSGDYSLSLTEAPEIAASRPIVMDETVRGSIAATDGVNATGQRADLYRLTGEAGVRVAIEMRSTAFDTYLSVFGDPDGQQALVAEDDDGLGEGTDSRIEIVLPDAGDYLIEARGLSGDETGAYTLKVEAVAPPPPAQPLAVGGAVQGEISDGDPRAEGVPYDAYGFSGDAGDRVQVVMRSGDFDTTVQIGSALPAPMTATDAEAISGTMPDGFVALATDDDGLGEGTDSRLIFVLPETGDYIVRALPLGAEGRGLYSIQLTDRGPKPVEGSIVVGATARGTLAEDDDVSTEGAYFDAYRLQAKAGDKLIVTMVSNAFDAFVDVGTQDGDDSAGFSSIKSDDDGLSDTHAKVEWTVEDDGNYLIRARGLSTGEVGAYALKVERDR